MPEISRFFGIVIGMFFTDHAPPHFHVRYGEHKAAIDIRTLAIIDGRLPPRGAWFGDGMGRAAPPSPTGRLGASPGTHPVTTDSTSGVVPCS